MAGELVAAGAAFGPWGAVIGGVAEVAIAVSKPTPIAPAFSMADGDFDGSGWNVNYGSGSIDSLSSAAFGDKNSGFNSASSDFDGSGWNVNFGSGSITSEAKKTVSEDDSVADSSEWLTLAMVLVVGLVVMKVFKK